MNEHRFAAMGCEVIIRGGAPAHHVRIERIFAERERIFSRFIPASELNRVNAAAGGSTLVSGTFADALCAALRAAEETDGLVDPTIGAAVEAAGYTEDWAALLDDPRPPGAPAYGGPIFSAGRVVGLPSGVRLDLNGVVKSMTVDDALAMLPGEGSVSAGGDVATRGPLTVALPAGGDVELRRGALATSGSTKRRWSRGGEVQHHLIDPRTGRPAVTPWAEVTACGRTCLAADIAAKAGFLHGEDGPAWLDARGIPGRFVRGTGDFETNRAWDRSMGEALACT